MNNKNLNKSELSSNSDLFSSKRTGKRAEYGRWKCTYCGLILETRKLLFQHTRQHRANPNIKCAWNKGLTKETDPRVKKCGETFSKKFKEGLIVLPNLHKPIPDDIKKRISESMKKAHAEGRAHNIGSCRWNNKPSYPESFFMKVIENEFQNKNYKREFPFYKYSLDFAWVDEKKAIEIDGEQHERFIDQINRDLQKDELLQQNGWKLLRIKWKDIMNDSKFWINKAKQFIDE